MRGRKLGAGARTKTKFMEDGGVEKRSFSWITQAGLLVAVYLLLSSQENGAGLFEAGRRRLT